MTGRYFSSANYHTPTAQRIRWLGAAGHRGEILDAPPQSFMDAKYSRRVCNGGENEQMEPDQHPGEPTTWKPDPNEAGIYTSLRNKYGLHNHSSQHRTTTTVQANNLRSATENG